MLLLVMIYVNPVIHHAVTVSDQMLINAHHVLHLLIESSEVLLLILMELAKYVRTIQRQNLDITLEQMLISACHATPLVEDAKIQVL